MKMKMIKALIVLSMLICMGITKTSIAQDQNNEHPQKIPLIITPIYNYKPQSINVGSYSERLRSLDNSSADSLISKFKTNLDSIPIEAIYVLSVRLYDLGLKDKSVYWFHTAKVRARVFVSTLDPKKIGGVGSPAFELKQAFISFNRLAGEYINGYAGGNIKMYIETFGKVKSEIDDIQPFKSLYPEIAFLPDFSLEAAKKKKKEGIDKFIAYLKENEKKIKKQRKKN